MNQGDDVLASNISEENARDDSRIYSYYRDNIVFRRGQYHTAEFIVPIVAVRKETIDREDINGLIDWLNRRKPVFGSISNRAISANLINEIIEKLEKL